MCGAGREVRVCGAGREVRVCGAGREVSWQRGEGVWSWQEVHSGLKIGDCDKYSVIGRIMY